MLVSMPLLLLFLTSLCHLTTSNIKIPLTWEESLEWRNVLTGDLAAGAWADSYWELPNITALAVRGSVVGMRVHFDSAQDARLYFDDNTDLKLESSDSKIVGRAVIKHVVDGGPRYVEMYWDLHTCQGRDGGPEPTTTSGGCYDVSNGYVTSVNTQFTAQLKRGDSYVCRCWDCDLDLLNALYRSRYVAVGTGDGWFTTLHCTLKSLVSLPQGTKNVQVDAYPFTWRSPVAFRIKCQTGTCNENAGRFRVEPIFESCNTNYYNPETGCYRAELSAKSGDVSFLGGNTVRFTGINLGDVAPTKCQVQFQGTLSSNDCIWISNTQIDIILDPWTQDCGIEGVDVDDGVGTPSCQFNVLYDGVEALSVFFSYIIPKFTQLGKIPLTGGELTLSGNFPEDTNGFVYQVFSTVTGSTNIFSCVNVQWISPGNELKCQYEAESKSGGCVPNSQIWVLMNKQKNDGKGTVISIGIEDTPIIEVCYEAADDTAVVTPRSRNLNPKSITEGNAATYQLTLSKAPTTTSTVTLSSVGNYKADCILTKSTLTFTQTNYDVVQIVEVTVPEDNRVQSVARFCRIKASAEADIEVEIPIIDDDTAGIFVLRPRTGGGEDYKLSFASYNLKEGKNISYKLSINSEPLGSVTVTPSIAADKSSRLKLVSQAVTFNMNNWQTPQTVKLSASLRPEYEGDIEVEVTHDITADVTTDPKYNTYLKDNGDLITLISVKDIHSVGITVSESFLTCKVGEKAVISLLSLTSRPSSPVNLEIKILDDSSSELKISHVSGGNQKSGVLSTLVNVENYLQINSMYSIDCEKKGSFTVVVSSTSEDSYYNTDSLHTEDPIRLNVGAEAEVPTVTASNVIPQQNGNDIVLSWNEAVFDKNGRVVPFAVDILVCSDNLCKNIVMKTSRSYDSKDRSYTIGAKDISDDAVDAAFKIDLELKVFYFKLGSDIYDVWSDPNKRWISASKCGEQEYLNVTESRNDPSTWNCVS